MDQRREKERFTGSDEEKAGLKGRLSSFGLRQPYFFMASLESLAASLESLAASLASMAEPLASLAASIALSADFMASAPGAGAGGGVGLATTGGLRLGGGVTPVSAGILPTATNETHPIRVRSDLVT